MKWLILNLCLLCSLTAFSQPKPAVVISGKLTDQNSGEAVSGASVTSKKDNNGTITDSLGNFQLPVSSLPVTLQFSRISFEPQEINVVDQSELAVSMVPF